MRVRLRQYILTLLLLLSSSVPAGAQGSSSPGPADQQCAPPAGLLSTRVKITFEQAERLAQRRFAGVTNEIELERMKDGRILYCVEIQNQDREVEVSIDAMSGEIVKVDDKPGQENEAHSDSKKSTKAD